MLKNETVKHLLNSWLKIKIKHGKNRRNKTSWKNW